MPLKKPGQILTELLIALGVATVAVVAMVQLATRSLSNASFARKQSQATAYASAGGEWLRSQRSTLGWDGFLLKSSTTGSGSIYCLSDLGWNVGACGTQEIETTGYVRELALFQVSPTIVQATVTTTWQEGAKPFSSKQVTLFSKAGEVVSGYLPSATPTPTPSPTPSASPFSPDANTVALYHFDAGSGSSALDSSSSNNSGTLVGSPSWNSAGNSRFGASSLQFDGTNRYVTVGHSSSLNFGSPGGAMTIEAWIKASVNGAILAKGRPNSGSSHLAYVFRTSAGKLYFSRWCQACPDTNNFVTGTTTITDGNWHHVAFVNAGASSHKLFVDGVLDAHDTTTWTLTTTNTEPLYIGEYRNYTYGTTYFTGTIDEVRISNIARY